MAHQVESMAWAGEPPWHGLGVEIERGLSPEEILKKAGLDWIVKSVPLYTEFNGKYVLVPHSYANQRQSDGKILSQTSSKYNIVQNADAFDFFTKFTKAGKMSMETAGSLDGGRFIWALARIDKSFKILGKDEMLPYLLLMQPHAVGHAMIFDFTGVRVVCRNTLNAALGSHLLGSAKAFRMPHLQVFDDDMKARAEIALGLAIDQFDHLHQAADMLARTKINKDDLGLYFDNVVKFNRSEAEAEDKPEPRVLEKYRYAFEEGPGSKLVSAAGTYWGALNAVTYVVDHHSARTDDTRLKGAWIGDGSKTKRRALNIAVEMARAA